MNPLHTPKRLAHEPAGRNNRTEWFCPYCQAWVWGCLINVTGYTELTCEDCGTTLEPDYYGLAELENSQEVEE